MDVSKTMKPVVASARPEMTLLEATQLLVQQKSSVLPVTAGQNVLIGLVTLSDILDYFIPNYFDWIENMQFVHDFGALEDSLPKDAPEIANISLHAFMKPPVSVKARESIFRATTRMMRHDLIELPVVDDDNRLVGLISHTDAGITFLQKWLEARGGSR